MTELRGAGDGLVGEKLVAWGRSVSRVRVISGTSAHRAQSVYVRSKKLVGRGKG